MIRRKAGMDIILRPPAHMTIPICRHLGKLYASRHLQALLCRPSVVCNIFPRRQSKASPFPSHSRLLRHGSIRSTGSTVRSAGHRHTAPLNPDSNRGGLHEQQTSYSASPLDKLNLSSLREAVRLLVPVSVIPGSQYIHRLQRFPETTKQVIPIARGPLPPWGHC